MQESLLFISKEQIDLCILEFLRQQKKPAHYETIMKAVKQSDVMIGERLIVLAFRGLVWENPHESFSIKL